MKSEFVHPVHKTITVENVFTTVKVVEGMYLACLLSFKPKALFILKWRHPFGCPSPLKNWILGNLKPNDIHNTSSKGIKQSYLCKYLTSQFVSNFMHFRHAEFKFHQFKEGKGNFFAKIYHFGPWSKRKYIQHHLTEIIFKFSIKWF